MKEIAIGVLLRASAVTYERGSAGHPPAGNAGGRETAKYGIILRILEETTLLPLEV